MINDGKDLTVYKKAYDLSMQIFHITKHFPKEEKWSLVDQIIRSSRSVCMNLREVWEKRKYKKHFISKLTDCMAENSETNTSIEYCKDCGYISEDQYTNFILISDEIRKMLISMIKNHERFLLS
jgi:four helix bundle protein